MIELEQAMDALMRVSEENVVLAAERDRLREALMYILDLDSRLSGLEDARAIAARALPLTKEAGQS
jgi:hypothetical protein